MREPGSDANLNVMFFKKVFGAHITFGAIFGSVFKNVWGASAKKIKCVGGHPRFFPVRPP